MTKEINSKKINVPHGMLKEIANRAESTSQSVGATLGVYTDTQIGVSDERKAKIREKAIEIAQEKKEELDSFIEAVKRTA